MDIKHEKITVQKLVDIDWLDKRISDTNITKTILEEFQKLYPLYEIMRHA